MNVSLRAAVDADLEACRRTYFAEMDWVNERLGLKRDEQESMFRKLWDPAQVCVIQADGVDVGWLQTVVRQERAHARADLRGRSVPEERHRDRGPAPDYRGGVTAGVAGPTRRREVQPEPSSVRATRLPRNPRGGPQGLHVLRADSSAWSVELTRRRDPTRGLAGRPSVDSAGTAPESRAPGPSPSCRRNGDQ